MVRRHTRLAAALLTTAALLASTAPAYAATWTPATVATTAPTSGVQVEVVPVTGYTGGSSGVWLQTSNYLQGAMDVAAQVAWNATGWSVAGVTAPTSGSEVYYQVVAVKINGVVYGSPTSTGTWVTASATGYTDQPAPQNPPTQPTSTALTPGTTAIAKPAAVVNISGNGTITSSTASSSQPTVAITNSKGQAVGQEAVAGQTTPSTGVVDVNVNGSYSKMPVKDCTAPDVLTLQAIAGSGVSTWVCVLPKSSSVTTTEAAQQQASTTPPFAGIGTGGGGPNASGWVCIGGARNMQEIPAGTTNDEAWCTA